MNTQTDPKFDIHEVTRAMVGAEVYANVGTMVEYILMQSDTDSAAPFSYDDITGIFIDPSDWDADDLFAFINDEMGFTWLDATGAPWGMEFDYMVGREKHYSKLEEGSEVPDDQIEAARAYIKENADRVEIFEWYAVSEWLQEQLEKAGEVVFSAGTLPIWGRKTTGQAIYMDRCMIEIATLRAAMLAALD